MEQVVYKCIETKGYEFISHLGEGVHGKVVKVKKIASGELFALKILNFSTLMKKKQNITLNLNDDDSIEKKLMQEIEIMQNLEHKNIVRFYEYFHEEVNDEDSNRIYKYFFVVMEYVNGGELFDYVLHNVLCEKEINDISLQLIFALQYCHINHNITHRDIKLENILYSMEDGRKIIKLCDFGLSTLHKDLSTTSCGSPIYAAPELYRNVVYDPKKVDMWALGICLYSLAYNSFPWSNCEDIPSIMREILFHKDIHFPDTRSRNLQRLIRSLLEKDPNVRSSCNNLHLRSYFCIEEKDWCKPGVCQDSNHIPRKSDYKRNSVILSQTNFKPIRCHSKEIPKKKKRRRRNITPRHRKVNHVKKDKQRSHSPISYLFNK